MTATRYIVVMTHRPDGWKSKLETEYTSYAQAELAAQQLMALVPGEYRDYEIREIKTN